MIRDHVKEVLDCRKDCCIKATFVASVDAGSLHRTIGVNVETGSTLHVDEGAGYDGRRGLLPGNGAINRGARKYVGDGVIATSIESVWTVMKRVLHGVHHHASEKCVVRGVDEFPFCLNDGNVARHTLERLASLVAASSGRHIAYHELTA